MTYPVVTELNRLWGVFEAAAAHVLAPDFQKLPDIKKLMTAVSVIDLSAHEIYPHAANVHELTATLLQLRSDHPEDLVINECCQRWLEVLQKRNQVPLKIKHHQKIDGECDFRFSLQLMQGKPCGLKEIQVLGHEKNAALDETVQAISRLSSLAHGHSFGNLPLRMKDKVLTSLMECKDVVCLVAKDQSDQIIGYSWGIMLRDVEISKNQKANIFWVMDLARDPDFHDDHAKVGEQLRARIVEELKLRNDCDFVGYQHVLNHKFHMGIVNNLQDEEEQLHLDDGEHAAHAAKTVLKYSDEIGFYIRAHFIRANANNFEYPDYKVIKPAIIEAFKNASHTMRDFIFGGIAFMGKMKYQQLTHKLLDEPIEQRISAPISQEQQACDADILKQIILDGKWAAEGKSLFSPCHTPDTIGKMQAAVSGDAFDFPAIKACVASRGSCVTRGVNARVLYDAVAVADSPTFALNKLLENQKTPQDWVVLITNGRSQAYNNNLRR